MAALGRDAVVLTTRQVKRAGLLGLLGATDVEIAAASLPPSAPVAAAPKGPFSLGAYGTEPSVTGPKDQASRAAVVNALRADLRSEIRAVKLALGRTATHSSPEAADLIAEMSAMREALEQLAPPAPRGNKVASLLRARGVDGRAGAVIGRALKSDSGESITDRLRVELSKMITVGAWPVPTRSERVVLAAVGLSGVGKTTTLAKLATLARAGGRTVNFVTCDTFRVGGVEQARRYATLLDIPFDTARSADELEAIIGRSKADLVIVDTSGREPGTNGAELLLNEERFAESDACSPFRRHVLLCTPGTFREVDVLRSVKSFGAMTPNALALTKLDETSVPSGIIHATWTTRLPVVATCAGPRVPEDIEPADVQHLVDLLVPRTESRKARAA